MRDFIVASLAEAWIEIKDTRNLVISETVASLAEAWIEIVQSLLHDLPRIVASLAEAWIEISNPLNMALSRISSLPLRKRGLKSWKCDGQLAGSTVASLAEAWIEIAFVLDNSGDGMSLPLRKRGLKCRRTIAVNGRYSRFPCGSVD